MIKKPKPKKSVSYWSKKADKQMQEIGREMYADKGCLICGGEYSCLHHFFPKSQSTYLRYNWKNLIPICQKCHYNHHNGNPEVHIIVLEIKGMDWFEELQALRNANRYVNAGYCYYRDMHSRLKMLEPLKIKS